eukprot:12743621-Heterocapsa_arctica.AAC.1
MTGQTLQTSRTSFEYIKYLNTLGGDPQIQQPDKTSGLVRAHQAVPNQSKIAYHIPVNDCIVIL